MNIVMINFDHQALHQWQAFPDVEILRPQFHRVAERGINFSNAYCAAPLCGPSRRTLLTGLYPHAHGQYQNETMAPYATPSFMDLLRQNGYELYYFGKWHAGPGNALDQGCYGFSADAYGNPYTTAAYTAYCKRYHIEPAKFLIENCFSWADERQRAYANGAAQYPAPVPGTVYQSLDPRHCCEAAYGKTVTSFRSHESVFLATLAAETLHAVSKQFQNRPFFMRIDFWGPHYPYFPTQDYLDLYRHRRFPQYPSFAEDLSSKPPVYRTERHVPIGHNNQIQFPNPLGWPAYEEILRYCAAQITMLDAAAGIVLDALAQCGLEDKTAILWTADHGDALACYGGHFDKGSYLCQEVLRVPLTVALPQQKPAQQIVSTPVSTVDVAPTILDIAGISGAVSMHGSSLLRYYSGAQQERAVLVESYGLGYGENILARAVISDEWKYIATRGQLHELYNLQRDPFELQNLIESAPYQSVRAHLQDLLVSLQQRYRDSALGCLHGCRMLS